VQKLTLAIAFSASYYQPALHLQIHRHGPRPMASAPRIGTLLYITIELTNLAVSRVTTGCGVAKMAAITAAAATARRG